ncbi:hypothetical protein BH23GEM6_BH23GEM6_11570 [soil metagenome]
MRIRATFLLFTMGMALPTMVSAQLFTPSYLAPRPSSDVGLHISDGFGRGGGLAVEGIWRRGFGGYGLGGRAGVGESGGDAVLLIGADYRRPLALQTAPVLIAATGGAQVAVGSASAFGIDAGATIGATFTPEGITVTPYMHPRLALLRSADTANFGPTVLADLGVEVEIQPNLMIRLGLGFGSETADFGIGLAWR